VRTLPSVRDPDQINHDLQPLAKQPALGAQRRTRIEVSSPAARTLAVGQEPSTNRRTGPVVPSPAIRIRARSAERGSNLSSPATRTSPSDSTPDQVNSNCFTPRPLSESGRLAPNADRSELAASADAVVGSRPRSDQPGRADPRQTAQRRARIEVRSPTPGTLSSAKSRAPITGVTQLPTSPNSLLWARRAEHGSNSRLSLE
jgi:hypothetical protein